MTMPFTFNVLSVESPSGAASAGTGHVTAAVMTPAENQQWTKHRCGPIDDIDTHPHHQLANRRGVTERWRKSKGGA